MTKWILALAGVLLSACQGGQKDSAYSQQRQDMEEKGTVCLMQAREALDKKQYDVAREHIRTLRSRYRLALNAREEALLLMDSIELRQMQDSLFVIDSLMQAQPSGDLKADFDGLVRKIKFLNRKIAYDATRKKKH